MSLTAGPRHRVLLVRQWDQQVGGSGCCGRLNSATVESLCETGPSPYAEARADMERMGEVYLALRDRLDPEDVEVTVVDPRNTVWLMPAVWRDGRRRGLPVAERLRQMARATAPCTAVSDGLVVSSDEAPDRTVAAVSADLAGRV